MIQLTILGLRMVFVQVQFFDFVFRISQNNYGFPRCARKDERAVIEKPERLWRSILVDDESIKISEKSLSSAYKQRSIVYYLPL